MSMIDPKGSRAESEAMTVIRMHSEMHKQNGNDPIVTAVVEDTILDVEEGIEFWKTATGKSQSKHGPSSLPQFPNGSGGTIADSIAQILP